MRLSQLLDAIFPAACAGCGAAGSPLCRCCLPSPEAATHFRIGRLAVGALGEYEGALRRAVLAFKHGRRDVGEALAAELANRFSRVSNALLASPSWDGFILVPVPTTARRRAERGFDQSVLLAEELGRRVGLGVVDVLRQTAGDAQRGRSRAERLGARGRYCCTNRELLAGARVILIDDVVTTGATLRDCSNVLSNAGADVAGAFVIARASRGGAGRG